MVRGSRVWSGIWIGVFFINTLGFASYDTVIANIIAGAIIGAGSVLQALIGCRLLNRRGIKFLSFNRLESILSFLAVIPVLSELRFFSCVVCRRRAAGYRDGNFVQHRLSFGIFDIATTIVAGSGR